MLYWDQPFLVGWVFSCSIGKKPFSVGLVDTVAHKGKTQLNIELDTQQSFVMHNNFSRYTTIFRDAKHFFTVHNNLSSCKTIFYGAQQSFVMHNNFSWYATIFRDAKKNFTVHNNLS